MSSALVSCVVICMDKFFIYFCAVHTPELKSELEFEHCWPILSCIFVVLDNCIICQMKYYVGERLWLLVDYMRVCVQVLFMVCEGCHFQR
jgi:hypothetical protein